MLRQIIRTGLLLMVLLIMGILFSQSVFSSDCQFTPVRLTIPIPEADFHWLSGEEFIGACDLVSANQWHVNKAKTKTIWHASDGPSGSGRYWLVTIGMSDSPALYPEKGFCLYTSTVGWRTLQQYDRTPLPWITDLDQDGKPEFLLWSSFHLSDEPNMLESALVVWVYELRDKENFELDWDLTENMAMELAKAYLQPLKPPILELTILRKTAGKKLKTLASGACRNTTVTNHK